MARVRAMGLQVLFRPQQLKFWKRDSETVVHKCELAFIVPLVVRDSDVPMSDVLLKSTLQGVQAPSTHLRSVSAMFVSVAFHSRDLDRIELLSASSPGQ